MCGVAWHAGSASWPGDDFSLLRFPGAKAGVRPALLLRVDVASSSDPKGSAQLGSAEIPLAPYILTPPGMTRRAWMKLTTPGSAAVEVMVVARFEPSADAATPHGVAAVVPSQAKASVPAEGGHDIATGEWTEAEQVALPTAPPKKKVRSCRGERDAHAETQREVHTE